MDFTKKSLDGLVPKEWALVRLEGSGPHGKKASARSSPAFEMMRKRTEWVSVCVRVPRPNSYCAYIFLVYLAHPMWKEIPSLQFMYLADRYTGRFELIRLFTCHLVGDQKFRGFRGTSGWSWMGGRMYLAELESDISIAN